MHRHRFRTTFLLSLLLPLTCAGCAVGDGFAQAVKWTGKELGKPPEPISPAAREPVRGPEPPRAEPPPAAAVPRDDIQVETLPPRTQDR